MVEEMEGRMEKDHSVIDPVSGLLEAQADSVGFVEGNRTNFGIHPDVLHAIEFMARDYTILASDIPFAC